MIDIAFPDFLCGVLLACLIYLAFVAISFIGRKGGDE